MCLLRLEDWLNRLLQTRHTCGRCRSCTCNTWIRSLSRFSKDLETRSIQSHAVTSSFLHFLPPQTLCTACMGTVDRRCLHIVCTWDVFHGSIRMRTPFRIAHTWTLRLKPTNDITNLSFKITCTTVIFIIFNECLFTGLWICGTVSVLGATMWHWNAKEEVVFASVPDKQLLSRIDVAQRFVVNLILKLKHSPNIF